MPKYHTWKPQLYSHSFFHEVYRKNVYLVWCCNKHRIHNFLVANQDSGRVDQLSDEAAASMFILQIQGQYVPTICLPFEWENTPENIDSLTHEAVHVAMALFRLNDVQIPQSRNPFDQDEENLCYTVGWIVRNCLKALQDQDNYKFHFEGDIESDYFQY